MSLMLLISVQAKAVGIDSQVEGMTTAFQSQVLSDFADHLGKPLYGIHKLRTMTLDVAQYYQVLFSLKYGTCSVEVRVDEYSGTVRLGQSNCTEQLAKEEEIEAKAYQKCGKPPKFDAEDESGQLQIPSDEDVKSFTAYLECLSAETQRLKSELN